MSPRVRVRRARKTDAAALARLMGVLGYPTSTAEMQRRLTKLLGRRDRTTFVATIDGRVIGMVGAQVVHLYERDGLWGRLNSMVVAPDAQRRGIGRRLLWNAEHWLRAKGAAAVTLTSGDARHGAHKFYESYGYERTGIRLAKALKRGTSLRALPVTRAPEVNPYIRLCPIHRACIARATRLPPPRHSARTSRRSSTRRRRPRRPTATGRC